MTDDKKIKLIVEWTFDKSDFIDSEDGGKYSQRQLALKLNITRYALQGWLYQYPPTAEECDLIMNFLEEMEMG